MRSLFGALILHRHHLSFKTHNLWGAIGPVWIVQKRAGKKNDVGFAFADYVVGLLGLGESSSCPPPSAQSCAEIRRSHDMNRESQAR